MKYHRILTNDVSNGRGIRVVIFVSGCHHHCPGCHNPQTWSFDSGEDFTGETFNEIIAEIAKPHIDGITLSGGDPLAPENLHVAGELAHQVKEHGKSVWCYTGYDYENVKDFDIMRDIDVLVDGRFLLEKKDNLRKGLASFRGSSNQRIIDMNTTRKTGTLTLLEE